MPSATARSPLSSSSSSSFVNILYPIFSYCELCVLFAICLSVFIIRQKLGFHYNVFNLLLLFCRDCPRYHLLLLFCRACARYYLLLLFCRQALYPCKYGRLRVEFGCPLNLLDIIRFRFRITRSTIVVESHSNNLSNANQLASSRASNSSKIPVSLTPTGTTDQSASTQEAPNSYEHLITDTSNQFDLTQPPVSSELQVDVISTDTNLRASTQPTPTSSKLPNSSKVDDANQFASTQQVVVSNSSELQINLTTNQLDPPDWAELDLGLISEIVDRLPTDEDFVSFKEVCCLWRSVCSAINWTTNPRLPWLMLSEKQDSYMRSFYSFDKNKGYEIQLRAAHGRRCFASPHGWIVTFGPDGEIHLLNPLSQDRKKLPPLRASKKLLAGDWFHVIHKLMVFKSFPNEFLVMAIYGSRYYLAFVRFGEREWNTVRDAFDIRDVAHFQGQFYALRAFGTLVWIKFSRPNFARAIFFAPPPEDLKIPDELYLVKSSSSSSSRDLLGVFRYGFVLEGRRETENFLVYKYEFDTEEWEKLEDLGDWVIFVGDGNSWSTRACNAMNVKSNRIYYADDYWKRQRGGGEVTYSGHDIGVFCMASGEIELLNFGEDFPSHFSRPIWFTPNLRLNFFCY